MTSLKKLLAFNMKERRRILDISQAALAERVNTSTHYIAMIELGRKTPSLSMIERIAAALQIDSPELFSMRSIPLESLKALHKAVLEDIKKTVDLSILRNLNDLENGKFSDLLLEDKE
jgi:transcriptional regulator with XRE-family HTH domain